jgi:carboxylesterase
MTVEGFLLIHGYAGTPHDVQPVLDRLQELNLPVSAPLLAGHGGTRKEMRSSSWQDWIQSAEEALVQLRRECDPVHLVGFSMGSLIAIDLAVRYSIGKMALLSPAVYSVNTPEIVRGMAETLKSPFDKRARALPLKVYMRRTMRSSFRSFAQFFQLVEHVRPKFPEVRVPTLIIQGERDDVVKPKGAIHLYHEIGSVEKKLVLLPQSRHLICHDCEVVEMMREIETFFGLPSQNPEPVQEQASV